MRLSVAVQNKIAKAIDSLPNEEADPLPDYEFWPVTVSTPDGGQGLHMMIALFVPLGDGDYTAPRQDIDPYASQGEFNTLITALYDAGLAAQHPGRLAVAPGLVPPGLRRSRGGLVLPR
jgi:hypothetical protein